MIQFFLPRAFNHLVVQTQVSSRNIKSLICFSIVEDEFIDGTKEINFCCASTHVSIREASRLMNEWMLFFFANGTDLSFADSDLIMKLTDLQCRRFSCQLQQKKIDFHCLRWKHPLCLSMKDYQLRIFFTLSIPRTMRMFLIVVQHLCDFFNVPLTSHRLEKTNWTLLDSVLKLATNKRKGWIDIRCIDQLS